MTHPIESICFDLDDTLFPYRRYARAGLEAAADRLEDRTGRRHHEELREIHFADDVTEGSFDVLVERHDLPAELVDELVEAYHGADGELTSYPETDRVLSRLGEEYRLGLVTDGRGGEAKLRRLGLTDHFETVLVTPTVGRTKRDPAVFERVLSELSVSPESAAYVGDDPRVDFRVPNELGMCTVRLRRGRYVDLEPTDGVDVPDHEIRDLTELPGIVSATSTAGTVPHRTNMGGTDGG
ncbi:HAD family hydrolase [Halopenitus persicus]|uniref:HAD family hydrolase n=1 Tax=Halopenitus persicus TaxID=1048396 RepID=UPI000BBB0105|nr:HAD-IA family hydrolase [Halopenitus persicus]